MGDYVHVLNDKLKQLYFDSELCKLIQSDKELVFAVRKNKIHIYYLGGRILEITGSRRLKLSFNMNYAKTKRRSNEYNKYREIIEDLNKNHPYDIDIWIEHFDDLKHCMEEYKRNVATTDERQLQQILELANRDFKGEVVVIDNEYAVRKDFLSTSTLYRVDLVALFKDSGKYKICLVELKYGGKAIEEESGIAAHIKGYGVVLNNRRKDIIASVKNLIEYKKAHGFLYNVPADIELDEENTEICVSILCYNLTATDDIDTANAEIEKGKEGITFELHYNLDLDKDRHIKLTKKDLLGE